MPPVFPVSTALEKATRCSDMRDQWSGRAASARALTASAAQGSWTVEAYLDPSLPAVGRATIAVQDFVPQQLAVTLAGPGVPLAPGAHLTAAIAGRFLYGAPAAGLHAEGTVTLVRDEHPVADAAGYSFGDPGEAVPDAVQVLELPDADGAGHVAFGGVAHRPWRVEAAEADLPRGAKAVTDAVFAGAEPTHENAYKLKLAERTLSAALNQARA